jgi:hypothetical protein
MALASLFALVLAAALPQDSALPRSRQLMLELAAEPRLAGTSGGLQGAKVAARQLRAAGWDVELDERVVVLSLPRRISVRAFADSRMSSTSASGCARTTRRSRSARSTCAGRSRSHATGARTAA